MNTSEDREGYVRRGCEEIYSMAIWCGLRYHWPILVPESIHGAIGCAASLEWTNEDGVGYRVEGNVHELSV